MNRDGVQIVPCTDREPSSGISQRANYSKIPDAHTMGQRGPFCTHRYRLVASCERGRPAKTRVSVVKMPLVGLESISNIKWVRPLATLHHAVMIDQEGEKSVWIFDVIPKHAKDPATLAKMVFLQPVPAINRCKHVRKEVVDLRHQLPPLKTYQVSLSIETAVEMATEFQRAWEPWIQLNFRDCRDHSFRLAAYLNGKPLSESLNGLA